MGKDKGKDKGASKKASKASKKAAKKAAKKGKKKGKAVAEVEFGAKGQRPHRKKYLKELSTQGVKKWTPAEILADESKYARASKFAFMRMDTDDSGALDMQEMIAALNKTGDSIDQETLRPMWEEIDADNNGEIDILEYTVFYRSVIELSIQEAEEAKKPKKKAKAASGSESGSASASEESS